MDKDSMLIIASWLFWVSAGIFILISDFTGNWLLGLFAVIIGVEPFLNKNKRRSIQCPECGGFCRRDIIDEKTTKKEGFFAEGKKIITFKCRSCKHEWEYSKPLEAGFVEIFKYIG